MNRPTPTLIALHGHGEPEPATIAWAERVAPGGWKLVTVDAPGARQDPRSWFDTGPRGVQGEDLQRSIEAIRNAVGEVSGAGPVVLAGFSQGAAMALACGEIPGVVAVVGICPFLPEVEQLKLGSGPPALVVPSEGDEVTPAFLGEDLAAAMRAAGREVELHVTSGVHEVSRDSAVLAKHWLDRRWPARPRISLGLPVDRVGSGPELVSASAVVELSAAYEELGFDAAYVTDHPAPDDRWLAAGGHQALEPTVALATAGSATSRLLLHTHVYILGYRSPFLAAKAISSLDLLTDGRVILGVAAGYLRPEFAALGSSFEDRAERLDEALELLPRIWSGQSVEATGAGFEVRSATVLPRPVQRPHPPIWVGGNSERAMRRAVRLGQGWSPFPTPGGLESATRTAAIPDLDSLLARLGRLGQICEQEGRDEQPTVCFTPFSSNDYLADPEGSLDEMRRECEQLWKAGVDWLALSVPGNDRAEVLANAESLAEAFEPSRPS